MTDKEKNSFHLLVNILLVIVTANMEAALWPSLFSLIPGPQVWISIIIYTFLYRSKIESFLIIYIPSLFIFMLSTQPLGYILLAQTALFFAVVFIRNRIFIPGYFYFSVLYATGTLFFQICIFIFGAIFTIKPLQFSQIWTWFAGAIISFLLGPIFYNGLSRIIPIDESSTANEESLL